MFVVVCVCVCRIFLQVYLRQAPLLDKRLFYTEEALFRIFTAGFSSPIRIYLGGKVNTHVMFYIRYLLVDGRVDHHPSAASKFSVRRDVHEHRVLVSNKGVHDLCPKLQDLAVPASTSGRMKQTRRE